MRFFNTFLEDEDSEEGSCVRYPQVLKNNDRVDSAHNYGYPLVSYFDTICGESKLGMNDFNQSKRGKLLLKKSF